MRKWSTVLLLFLAASPAFAKFFGKTEIEPQLKENALVFDKFVIQFERTLRIPDDGKTYPLPPSLGDLPIYPARKYTKKLPKHWEKENTFFIPMYQREAMWISFEGERWRPRAVKIGIGNVNVLTGGKWTPTLKKQKQQDYLVAPVPQPWIDGIKTGAGKIRQFLAMPLGKGYTVEGQTTGKEKIGGIQIAVYNPKKGKFKKPAASDEEVRKKFEKDMMTMTYKEESAEMGLGAGGTMQQKIYPDPHGFKSWDTKTYGKATVYIVNSDMFERITGKKPPETPITKEEYETAGYPWFDLYDSDYKDLPVGTALKKIKSVQQLDSKKGIQDKEETSIKVKTTIKYEVPKK